jgi:uridylate kinase
MVMKLVIKLGGSMTIGENGPDHEYFKKLLPVLKKVCKENKTIVSIGGGKLVRKYFENAKKFGIPNNEMEWIGINLLDANVRFLSFLLKTKPIFNIEEINTKTSGVIGGIKPGRSTDANAAIAAKLMGADLIIKLTNVDGVYDKDPNKFNGAKRIDKISFNDAMKYATDGRPGDYGVFDKVALATIKKHKIRTVIIDGKDPKNILKVLKGDKIGTTIC